MHLDTAQIYFNEDKVGEALELFDGPKPWVTTKWSGAGGKGIEESIHESLDFLKLKSVDVRLCHAFTLRFLTC